MSGSWQLSALHVAMCYLLLIYDLDASHLPDIVKWQQIEIDGRRRNPSAGAMLTIRNLISVQREYEANEIRNSYNKQVMLKFDCTCFFSSWYFYQALDM